MGTSTSKKSLASTSVCECLPFRLQPFCISNRHMHAYIIEHSPDICIDDLTYKKKFLIKNVIDSSQQLQAGASLPTGLTSCNLIANHWDLVVVQVFYRKGVEFYVCNLSSQTCIYKYMMCPCIERHPGLCEAYFTTNKQFLILKANDIYSSMFSNGKELENSFIEVVKLDEMTIKSNHYVLPSSKAIPFGLCPDPGRPTEIYTAFCYFVYDCSLSHRIYSDMSKVDVSIPFEYRSGRKYGKFPNRLHAEYDMALHVGVRTFIINSRIINIQIPRNSSFILLSSVRENMEKMESFKPAIDKKKLKPTAVPKYITEVELRMKTLESSFARTWIYNASNATQLDWPKLSPNGTCGVVDGQLCLFSDRNVMKSLSVLCVDLLTELILPEDVHFLPLPEKLRDLLRFGDIEKAPRHKFKTTSV